MMDKQRINITLMDNGDLRLKTKRIVTPVNPIIKIENNAVYWKMNKVNGTYKYVGVCDIEDYINNALWAFNIKYNSSDLTSGSVVFDTGYSQIALTGRILGTTGKAKTYMHNLNRMDCRRKNIYTVAE
jgi:hypothetical protein